MASRSQTLQFSEWILYSKPVGSWSNRYTASATVTVSRATGSSTATVTIDTRMVTSSGDDGTVTGWYCTANIGGTDYRFQCGVAGPHYAGTAAATQTASQTYNISVGGAAGTLTGSIKFEIAPYGERGNNGGYSPSLDWSIAYDSVGESTISSISKSSVSFGESFDVVVSRPVSEYRESIIIRYGTNYGESTVLSAYNASGSQNTTRTVSIPISLGSGRGTSFNFKISIKTYNGSTQVGSENIDSTVRTVSFSNNQRSTATWSNYYFGNTSTVTITRPASYFRETVKLIWSNGTEQTIRAYNASGSDSTTATYLIPYNACPTNATTRTGSIQIISYNGTTQIGNAWSSSNYTVAIKSGDNHYRPSIGSVTTTISNTISALGSQAVVGTSKVYAQLPIGNVSVPEGGSVSSTKITFPDGKTKSGGNATISETSNVINSATYTTTFEVTDSRGLTVTKTQSINAITVADPTFSSLEVYRANSSGVRDDTGSYIYAIAVPSYQAKIGSVDNSCSIAMSVNGGASISVTAGTLTRIYSDADTTTAYTVSASVSDLVHTTTVVRTVSAEAVSFNIKNEGDGIGIGKYASHTNAIDIAYDILTDGNVVYKNYQNVVNAGTSASIDNGGKGLSIYYVTYCGLNSNDEVVSGTSNAGMIVLFEGTQIMKNGFDGLTTSISGTTFSFSFSSGSNKLMYRVFENNLGGCITQ